MKELKVPGFDEDEWDKERIKLEESVKEAVDKLSYFMGCTYFVLPFNKLTVKVTPSDA